MKSNGFSFPEKIRLLSFIFFFAALSSSCEHKKIAVSAPPSDHHQPTNFVAEKAMIVAAHPLAVKAGLETLKTGGNAVDAAVAAAFALNVCEPFASGIGGGGFMVVYVASKKKVTVINYREKAPSLSSPQIFDGEGKIKTPGMAVAVPGALAGWTYALDKYGSKNLAEVMEKAVEMAEDGFSVSETFSLINKDEYEKILQNGGEETCYLNHGLPYEPGDTFQNPDLAKTLKTIAANGIDEFYRGRTARKIVKAVEDKGGVMNLADLENYQPVELTPLSGTYEDCELFTLPLPGSGGLHTVQLLNIIENWPVKKWNHNSPPYIHHFCEALRFIFADRERYAGDPDFIAVPATELISKKYAARIVSLIKPESVLGSYPWTEIEGKKSDRANTTHLCVVDEEGNIVSLTQSINDFFGTGIVPQGTGFLLNNQMNDFSPDPLSPNAALPLRRPVSSMGPLIMFKKGKPFLVLGSPGGTRIFSSLTQIIINIVEFGMSLDEAIEAPRFFSYSSAGKAGGISVESRIPPETLEELKAKGHEVDVKDAFDKYFGGAQGILILGRKRVILGGADSRRDGSGAGY